MYQEKSQMVLDCNSAGLTLILFPLAGFLRKRRKLLLLQKLQNLLDMIEANHAKVSLNVRLLLRVSLLCSLHSCLQLSEESELDAFLQQP